ncbi:alanine racemase [Pseudodesulfovibrio sp.]|uniref:alanine racemase n=1 Tax=Pseudodesulfovibrio sp. TaxID=2035812 RepID=UPI00261DB6A9|nr:alanine racemase [Pseudodesulfovibrio sp.]MDD3311361.1 alanine racemase [Pseudodesulfovibrio sp.]
MIDYNKIRVRVTLDNLRHNYRVFTAVHPHVIPVIKSDAYGHGLAEVARVLEAEGADTFGVGFVSEAADLRRSGCKARILALLGPVDDADYASLWSHDVLAFIGRFDQLERLAEEAQGRGPLDIALKFDTGMRRLGFSPDQVDGVVKFLKAHPAVRPVMASSHLARADEPGREADVALQGRRFEQAVDGLKAAGFDVEACLANTAGALAHEAVRHDSMRLGIGLYGCNPLHGTPLERLGAGLRPAMEVSAPILQVRELKAGEGISYGWTHVAEHDSVVAIVGAGYADAYSRTLSNKGFMNVKGRLSPIVGRVCMQMTAIDVTDALGQGAVVRPGDEAWLLGGPAPGTISPEDLAGWWGSITYEPFCLLGMNPREYV